MRWLGLLAILLFTSATPALASGGLHTDGRFFRDATGAVVLLRGVDIAGNSKVPNFEPITPALLDPLPGWGVNVLRLLFTWEAYEGQRGVYDDAGYLAYYVGVVRAAAQRGLYVVVDFHQDAFSRVSLQGCGEGFPQWAIPPSLTPATPDNGADCADWGQRQLADADLATTWNDFYSDANGARSAYLAMVGRVAAALAAEPMVVGYDLLNEPGGDEITQIAPLYADAAQAIRAVDPSAVIFVSPAAITSAGNVSDLPQPSFANYAYSPHYYDPFASVIQQWQGNDESRPFATMNGVASAWNVPLFVGEFGSQPDVERVDGYMNAMRAQLDLALASGSQWAYTPGWTATAKDGWNREDFSIVDDHGLLRANFTPRPYARRIAGTPSAITVSFESVAKQRTLQLDWTHDPAAGATELFVPAAYFGGEVHVSGSGDVRCSVSGDLARCSAATAGVKHVHAAAPSPACGLTGAEALLVLALLRRRRRAR